MKPKTMILMIVAVGCGLAASYMTSKLLAERKTAPPSDRLPILVAKTKVPKFTVLNEPEKFFDRKERLKEDLPPQGAYFTEFAEIKDKRINREFKPDVHISPEDVAERSATVLPIPDGFGSMGIKVTAASAVSYFVAPGDKVDVLLTTRGEQASAFTILRDVLVLAVAEKMTKDTKEGDSAVIVANTVTVAVKSDDANLVRLAETQGELSLLLRKEGDKTEWKSDRIITPDDLKRAGRGSPLAFATKPAEEKPTTLPLGIPFDAIKKADPKEEPEEKVEPIKPKWEVTIEYGNAPSQKIPYFEKPDGTLTREAAEQPAAKAPDKKPEKKK